MPPKPRPGSITSTTRPRTTVVGTPDVVAPSIPDASRAYSESVARAIGVPQIANDLALTRGIWADASKGLDLSGMDAATKKEAVLTEIRKRGPQYWAPWITNFKKSQPQDSAPAAAAPQAAPAADPLDAPVVDDDAPSAPTPAKPAARSSTPANQAPPGPSKAMRAWLVRYGEMPQEEVDAMSDSDVAAAKAKMQKASSGRPAPADAKPAAQTGKRSRSRPRRSGANPAQGESGVRRPTQTGSVVETEGEGVVHTVGDTPASTADLENLSPEKLEELLLKARVRQATRGSQIDVGRGSVGELPTMDAPPAGLGVGADEFVVNKFGGSQTTPAGAAPPPPPPPPPPGGGGPPDPPNDPPDDDPFLKWPSEWFGTYKGAGGQTKDTVGRALLRRSPQIAAGAGIAAALGGGAWWLMSGDGKSKVSQAELEMLRQRAIEGRMRNQELWGTYQDKPAPIQMAPPDMPAPPENNIRAFQRGVR